MSEPTPILPRGARVRRRARRLAGVVLGLAGILLIGPGTLLVVIAETRAGRLAGVLACVSLGMVVCLVALVRPIGRAWPWASALAVLALAAGLLTATLVRRVPSGASTAPSGLQSRFLVGRTRRITVLDLVPEIDQVKLAVTMLTRLVPWMPGEKASRLRAVTMRLAREVEAEPSARDLGSVTALAVDELLGRDFDAGHYYAYVPAHEAGERLGGLVFLHGNGGNLKVFPWSWRPFAERERVVVICPTFGFGFWGPGGVEAVERARADAVSRLPIDPGRVDLAGHSDGGKGVTRSASAHPDRYRGLIYLSPTMLRDELAAPAFADAWRGRPILVVQGDRDWNVTKASVDPAVDLLRRQGSEVTYSVFPGEDHFLLFGRSEEVFDLIARWMSARSRPAGQ